MSDSEMLEDDLKMVLRNGSMSVGEIIVLVAKVIEECEKI